MSLKFTGELFVMTMKNDAKLERELTCHFKLDMRNLTNFDPSTRKSQNLHFNELFLMEVYNVQAKKEELYLKLIDAKFEGNLICAF